MTIYSGFTQLQNGGSFHSYVKLPEGMDSWMISEMISGWLVDC